MVYNFIIQSEAGKIFCNKIQRAGKDCLFLAFHRKILYTIFRKMLRLRL